MTDNGEESPGDLTPKDLDHTHLPEQKMYKVDPREANHFKQVRAEKEGRNQVNTYPLFITNEFKILYFEMEARAKIDWHTHTPSFDEVCMCLRGKAKYTLEREDGSHQVMEIEPREFVYIPGGARHKIEAVGEHRHEGIATMPADPVARLEMLEGRSPYHMDDWPVALWIDRKRDEVVEKDTNAVSE